MLTERRRCRCSSKGRPTIRQSDPSCPSLPVHLQLRRSWRWRAWSCQRWKWLARSSGPPLYQAIWTRQLNTTSSEKTRVLEQRTLVAMAPFDSSLPLWLQQEGRKRSKRTPTALATYSILQNATLPSAQWSWSWGMQQARATCREREKSILSSNFRVPSFNILTIRRKTMHTMLGSQAMSSTKRFGVIAWLWGWWIYCDDWRIWRPQIVFLSESLQRKTNKLIKCWLWSIAWVRWL